jgi:hypothetical protein
MVEKLKFNYRRTIFETIKYKGKWTVKSKGGILALAPYKTEKQLIDFMISAGAKRI